ncbi:MAG: hypothetical protein KGY81_02835 [Phycisphaerae bacterium]|nr:hypothetical protein [Phycisphaerae bacterium]
MSELPETTETDKATRREAGIARAMWLIAVGAGATAGVVSGSMLAGLGSAPSHSAGIGGAIGGLLWRWRVGAALRRDPERELTRAGVVWGIVAAAFGMFMLWWPHTWPLVDRAMGGDATPILRAREHIVAVGGLSLVCAAVVGLLCGGILAGIWQALLGEGEKEYA